MKSSLEEIIDNLYKLIQWISDNYRDHMEDADYREVHDKLDELYHLYHVLCKIRDK